LVGLEKERQELVDRIERLWVARESGTIFISAPRGRGKTALLSAAIHDARKQGYHPKVIHVDLSDPPTEQELRDSISPKAVSTRETDNAMSAIFKLAGDAGATVAPVLGISLICKLVGAVPDIVGKVTEAVRARNSSGMDFSLHLLQELASACCQKVPVLVVIENVESGNVAHSDVTIASLTEIVRRGLGFLLVVTYDERSLSPTARQLLQARIDAHDAAPLMLLDPPTASEFAEAVGRVSDGVLREIHQLANGCVKTFQEIWDECQNQKVIVLDENQTWEWNDDAEKRDFGKTAEGFYRGWLRLVETCKVHTGDERLVRLALGIGALFGEEFKDCAVADVLWRMGKRLETEFYGENGHLNSITDLFDGPLATIVEDTGFDVDKNPLHKFKFKLFRHFAIGDIPSEDFKDTAKYCVQVLAASEEGNSRVAWRNIELLAMAGMHKEANDYREKVTTFPTPRYSAWELRYLSAKIRDLGSDADWFQWVMDVYNHFRPYPTVQNDLIILLDEVITVATISSRQDILLGALIAKGQVYSDQSEHCKALELAQQVTQELGDDDCSLLYAKSKNLQGVALSALHRFDEAENALRHAISILESIFGHEDPQTLTTVNNLACLLMNRGNYAAAQPLFERVAKISERVQGFEHPDTLRCMHNFAHFLGRKGDYSAAQRLHERVLEARERVQGPDHPDTLACVYNLACLLKKKGDHAAAQPLFARIQQAREHVAMALVNKGVALVLANRLDEAVAAYDEVVNRFDGAPEPALREWVLRALRHAVEVLEKQGRKEEAEARKRIIRGLSGSETVEGATG